MQTYNAQFGRGLGGILGSVVRRAIPYVVPAIAAAGKRALKAGARRLFVKGVQAIDESSPYHRGEKTYFRGTKRKRNTRPKTNKSKRRKRDALS